MRVSIGLTPPPPACTAPPASPPGTAFISALFPPSALSGGAKVTGAVTRGDSSNWLGSAFSSPLASLLLGLLLDFLRGLVGRGGGRDLLGRGRKRGLLRCGRGRHRRKFDHNGARSLRRHCRLAPSHHRRRDGAMHKQHDYGADRPAAQGGGVCRGECHHDPDAFSNPTSATLR